MPRLHLGPVGLLLLGMATLFAWPMTASVEKVWLVPPEKVLPPIHRIVITRTEVVGNLVVRDSQVASYDSLIAQAVQDAGYEVVPGWTHRALWNQIADSLWGGSGGTDSGSAFATDEIALARTRAMRAAPASELTMVQMRARYDPDAWIYPRINMFTIPFTNGTDGGVLVEIEIQDRNGASFFLHSSTSAMMFKRDSMTQYFDSPAERWLMERKSLGHEFTATLKPFVKATAELRKKGRMQPPS